MQQAIRDRMPHQGVDTPRLAFSERSWPAPTA
jgi:hypothetical protein